MFKCPSCKKRSISLWQKLNLSPISVIECKDCGASLTAPWWVSALAIASSLFIVISLIYANKGFFTSLVAVFYLVFVIAYLAFIPMIKKSS